MLLCQTACQDGHGGGEVLARLCPQALTTGTKNGSLPLCYARGLEGEEGPKGREGAVHCVTVVSGGWKMSQRGLVCLLIDDGATLASDGVSADRPRGPTDRLTILAATLTLLWPRCGNSW